MVTLNNFLLQRNQPIEWPIRMKWCMQLTNALLYLHQSGIVHRDIRCVNILLTKNWDIKISDFGVSIWAGRTTTKGVYIGGKGMYELASEKETSSPQFDIRLLGIVFAKMLLFGEQVSQDTYNWKTNTIDVSCDRTSYSDLIQSCFHPNITTPYIAAFVRSICAHEFGNFPELIKEQPSDAVQKLQTAVDLDDELYSLFKYKIEDNSLIQALVDFGTNTAIAVLATIPPDKLKSKLEFLSMNGERKTMELTARPGFT